MFQNLSYIYFDENYKEKYIHLKKGKNENKNFIDINNWSKTK